MRRKGEIRQPRSWVRWGPGHPVYRMITSGNHWLDAWTIQSTDPWPLVTRRTGITAERLAAIRRHSDATPAELALLAGVWKCPIADVSASIALNDAQFVALPRMKLGPQT